jgi:hypothetical protein
VRQLHVPAALPQPTGRGEITWYPLNRRLSGPQSPYWRFRGEETLLPLRVYWTHQQQLLGPYGITLNTDVPICQATRRHIDGCYSVGYPWSTRTIQIALRENKLRTLPRRNVTTINESRNKAIRPQNCWLLGRWTVCQTEGNPQQDADGTGTSQLPSTDFPICYWSVIPHQYTPQHRPLPPNHSSEEELKK